MITMSTIKGQRHPIPSSVSSSFSPFFSSSSSSSSNATFITLDSHTVIHSSKQRRQKRTKEEGRWFPSPRPRYNQDGRKMKSGASYPYPSGGNRLPFVKRGADYEEEHAGVEVVWGKARGRSRERKHERDRAGSNDVTEDTCRDKSKGKGKEVEMVWKGENRIEPVHEELEKRRSDEESLHKRDESYERTVEARESSGRLSQRELIIENQEGSGVMARREPSLERLLIKGEDAYRQHESPKNSMRDLHVERTEDEHERVDYQTPWWWKSTTRSPPGSSGEIPFDSHSTAQQHFPQSNPYHDLLDNPRMSTEWPAWPLLFQQHYLSQSQGVTPMQLHLNPSPLLFPTNDHGFMIPNLHNTQCFIAVPDQWTAESPWLNAFATFGDGIPPAIRSFNRLAARMVLGWPHFTQGPNQTRESILNLQAEHDRISHEIELVKELQAPLSAFLLEESLEVCYDHLCDEMLRVASNEFNRLQAHKRSLTEQIEELEYEMNAPSLLEELDLDRLSLVEEEDDDDLPPFDAGPSHWHHNLHEQRDDTTFDLYMNREEINARSEAKAQLQQYNARWSSILSRPPTTSPSTSTALTRPIEIPYPRTSPTTTPSSQKWEMYKLLCLAFNLHPYRTPPNALASGSSEKFRFCSDRHRGKDDRIRRLRALRKQLKMEKVRWHEDKLRAVFGEVEARSESAKAVWGIVCELKLDVDEALERVGY